MALIVEDGSGMPDSESYTSVAEATQYHADRLNDAWTDGDVSSQEAALRRATEWLDATFGRSFIGYRFHGRNQMHEWPRSGAYVEYSVNGPLFYRTYAGLWYVIDNDIVPFEVKRATAEAALRELTTPGVLYPDILPGRIIKNVSISGSISVSYANSTIEGQRTIISIVTAILRPLLDTSIANTMFVTASRNS
jgi:hypothetical protein